MRQRHTYPLKLAGFGTAAVACVITFAIAAVYPGFINMITDPGLIFSVPQVARPSYLVPVTDPTFGTRITRIANNSGQSTSPVSGTWGTDARHHYSKDQPWNSDNSLIIIENRGGGASTGMLVL
ncbi:MAG: hypothetical protein ACREJF_02010, partial [Candidatus Methylomirabilales bacterium]